MALANLGEFPGAFTGFSRACSSQFRANDVAQRDARKLRLLLLNHSSDVCRGIKAQHDKEMEAARWQARRLLSGNRFVESFSCFVRTFTSTVTLNVLRYVDALPFLNKAIDLASLDDLASLYAELVDALVGACTNTSMFFVLLVAGRFFLDEMQMQYKRRCGSSALRLRLCRPTFLMSYVTMPSAWLDFNLTKIDLSQ